MRKGDNDIDVFIKRIFPKVIEHWPKTPCPDENTIAEFLDGRLRGKRLNDLYSHLVKCQDCENVIRDLRESMAVPIDGLEYETSERLHKKVKELFPPEPKEWEIGLKKIGKKFEVITHTGELGLTFPELEMLSISTEKQLTLNDRRKIIHSIETVSLQLSNIVKKVEQITSDLAWINEEVQRFKAGKSDRQKERSLLKKRTDLSKLLSDIKMKEPSGFFFRDHFEKYNFDLFLTKPQMDKSDLIEIKAGICDPAGKPPEDFEFSLMRGQKTIEKAMAQSGITISKKIEASKFHIKFRQYGIYMGQVAVSFKK